MGDESPDEAKPTFLSLAWDVVRASTIPLFFASLALGLSLFVVGIPLLAYAVGRAFLAPMGIRERWPRTLVIGLCGSFAVVLPWFAAFAPLTFPPGPASEAIGPRLGVVAALTLVSALTSPLFATPFIYADRRVGVLEATLTSGSLASRAGLAPTLGTGLALGLVSSSPALVDGLARAVAERVVLGGWAVVLSPFFASLLNLALLFDVWKRRVEPSLRERAGAPTVHQGRASARITLLRSLAFPLLTAPFVLAVALLALGTPTPAWRTIEATEAAAHAATPLAEAPRPLSDRGLEVRLEAVPGTATASLVIETADGGGAGRVRLRSIEELLAGRVWYDRPAPDAAALDEALAPTITRERFRGREVWSVAVRASERQRLVVSFDDDGVRADDTLVDRARVRLGGALGAGVTGLYVVVLLALFVFSERSARVASSRGLPEFRGARELAAISGKLRGLARIDGASLVLDEPATLDVPRFGAILMPPGRHPFLVTPRADARSGEGSPLTVIATVSAADAAPFRGGNLTLPEGSWVALGSLDDARLDYASHVGRKNIAASLLLIPLSLLLLAIVLSNL